MIFSLAALAAPAFAAPPVVHVSVVPSSTHSISAAPDDQKARWYDLRAIVAAGAATPPGVNLTLHLTSSALDSLVPASYDLDLGEESRLSFDDCVSAIRASIDADEEAALGSIESQAGLVRVIGNDAAQSAAARAVEAFGAVIADSVDVEVYRVDDEQIPDGTESVLDAKSADELVAGLERPTVARNAVRMGRATSLGAEDSTTYLCDYDVEVAQGAIAADPAVTIVRTGLDVGVRIDRASDGRRFVVRVWGRDGELQRPIAAMEITALGSAPIELPRVATSMWTSSAILEPGGAIVIDHDGGGASALVVRLARGTGAAAPAALLPLGELALSPMRPSTPWLAFAKPSGGWNRPDDDFVEETAPWSDGEGIASFVADALEEPMSSGLALTFGSGLLLPAPDSIAEAARQAIDELREAAAVETIAVEIRYGFLTANDARDVLADGGVDAFAGRGMGRLLGCGIENDALLLVGGEEFAYVQDHDVEIAAGATIPDPIISEAFEGIAVWCAPLRSPNGKVTAWFDVQAHAPVGLSRSIEAVSYRPMAGDGNKNNPSAAGEFQRSLEVQLPQTRRAAARTLVQANAGEWALVTVQPIAGSERTLVVAARMDAR